ncbi:MAG: hypothetical protein ACPGWR_08440 [Ardenticatenaceae bacterium]
MLKQAFTIIDQVALRQHREPMAFFEDLKQKRISRTIWQARLSAMFVVIIFLFSAKNISHATWVSQFVNSAGKIFTGQIYIFGMLLITTQAWRFWLLYLFSLPILTLLFLCGLADTAPALFRLGWFICLPFVVGVLLTDVMSLMAYKRVSHVRSQRVRQRSKGPTADLPALRQWLRVRRIRLAVASVLIVAAIATPLWLESNQSVFWWAVGLLFGAAGCTHLDATLLAYFGKQPLVKYDPQRGDMRTTYIGRHALFVPCNSLIQAITPQPEGQKASAALLALLREGGLGPLVRSLWSHLPDEQRHSLLLHLSLREGGAEAIRFLSHKSSLPDSLSQVATWYADLAGEAAKPLDLQQWIGLLKEAPECSDIPMFDHHIRPIFSRVSEALLQYNDAASITFARQEVADFVETLYAPLAQSCPPPHALSWPVALRLHLERRELLAP